MEKEIINSPEYKDIFDSIVRQLNERKGLLFRRILKMFWPIFVGIIFFFLISFLADTFNISEKSSFINISFYFLLIWGILSVIYIIIMQLIFSNEKKIWIDSHFDRKRLNSEQSWKIAKKLILPSFIMRIQLFFRYYFIAFLIYFIGIFFALYLPFEMDVRYNPFIFVSLFIIIGPILIYLYFYYLKIKLRYFWFIFLDYYGDSNFSRSFLFEEMKKLNEISSSDSFKKSLMVSLGADLTTTVAHFSLGSVTSKWRKQGDLGGAAANITMVYGNELTSQSTDLARLAANYTLYCHAREHLYGEKNKVNDYIYSLIK